MFSGVGKRKFDLQSIVITVLEIIFGYVSHKIHSVNLCCKFNGRVLLKLDVDFDEKKTISICISFILSLLSVQLNLLCRVTVYDVY